MNFATHQKWIWVPGMAFRLAGVKFRIVDVDATGIYVLATSFNNPTGDDLLWLTPTHYGAEPDLEDEPTVELLTLVLRAVRNAPDGACRPLVGGGWIWEDRPNAFEGFAFFGEAPAVAMHRALWSAV